MASDSSKRTLRPKWLPRPCEIARKTGMNERTAAGHTSGRRCPRIVVFEPIVAAFPDLGDVTVREFVRYFADRYREQHK